MTHRFDWRAALRREHTAILLLAGCSLVLIWAFPFFPTQDGPTHLHNASSVKQLLTTQNTILHQYYGLSASPQPTWLAQAFLALLMSVIPPLVAEKVLLTAYVLGLPAALGYAVRPANASSSLVVVLGFAFAFNYPLYMGFYGFALSLPLLFVTVGWWLRNQRITGLRAALVLSLLLVVLFFAHPLSLLLFMATAVLLSAWFSMLPEGEGLSVPVPLGRFLGALRSRLTLVGIAAVPALALLAVYVIGSSQEESRVLVDLASKAKGFAQLTSLNALHRLELDLSRGLALLLLGLAGHTVYSRLRGRTVSCWDGILSVIVVIVAASFVAPAPSKFFLHDRLNLLAGLFGILWLGGQPFPRPVRFGAIAAGTLIAIGFWAVRLPAHSRLNADLQEFMAAADLVRPNSTLGSVRLVASEGTATADYTWRTDPFLHAAGYLALDRPVVLLTNYQALKSYFPIRFRVEREPFSPAVLDSARVDLVIVREHLEESSRESDSSHFGAVLRREYERVPKAWSGAVSAWRPRSHRAAVGARRAWKLDRLEPAPVARYASAAAVIGGKLYVFGGFDSLLVARREVYTLDPTTYRWERKRDMPIGVNHANAVYDGRYLWFAGGFVGAHPGRATSAVWKYDVASDTWQPGPPLPAPRASGGLAFINDRFHYFGGYDNNQYPSPGLSEHWALDPSLGEGATWSARAPMPKPRGHLGVAVLNGRIYAVGGTTPHDPRAIDYAWTHAYDPSKDTWEEVAELPRPRSHVEPSTFVLDGKIVVVGGFSRPTSSRVEPREVSADVTAYDPLTDAWEALAPLPKPLMAPVAQPVGTRVFIAMGGAPPRGWDNLRREVYVAELPPLRGLGPDQE